MKCVLCSSQIEMLKQFKYCKNCNLIQKENIPNSVDEKSRYLEHNNKCEDVQYQNYFLRYLNNVLKTIDKDSMILDYGSGIEPVLQYTLFKQGYKNVHIYDKYFAPSEDYLNCKYDAIFIIEVIEHIYDIEELIVRLKSLLKRDGRIIIKTEIYEDVNNIDKWWYVRDHTHISFFNLNTFKFIASKFNFKLEVVDKVIVLRNI